MTPNNQEERLKQAFEEIEYVLNECADYMDGKADAIDGDPPTPNKEMQLFLMINSATEKLLALSSHTEQGEEMETLFEEARELVVKLLPPEKYGEDYDADRLWCIIEQLYGNTIDPQPIIEQLRKERGEEVKSAEEILSLYVANNYAAPTGYVLIKDALDAIDIYHSQFKSSQGVRWVKTSDRLPKNGQRAIVKETNGLVFQYTFWDGHEESWKKDITEWLDELSQREVNQWIQMVKQWHEKFRVPVKEYIGLILDKDRFEMRHNILLEEIEELKNAYEMCNMVEVADAIADILYVIIGTALEFGLHNKLDEIFAEVHRSNMSKLDANGMPIVRADGKILKSDLFVRPNIKSIIE